MLATPVETPALYEPVAMGIFWPILSVARWPSVARTRGFCRMCVSASVSRALSVPPVMLTAKLVALRWASELRVKLDEAVVVPVVVVVLVGTGALGLACGVRPKD